MSEANLVQVKFERYQIRRILDSETEEWWYALVDVIDLNCRQFVDSIN